MKKRLRKKLRVGEFKPLYFQATLSVRSPDQWSIFNNGLADFMSNKWRHWGFGYGLAPGERKYSINVGVSEEAETRRDVVIRWIEERDDVQLIAVSQAGPSKSSRMARRKNW
jgi:uncharacterized protein YggL (DUF469 family)